MDSPFFDYLTRYVNDGIVKDVESMKTEKKAPNFKEMLKVAGKELETYGGKATDNRSNLIFKCLGLSMRSDAE